MHLHKRVRSAVAGRHLRHNLLKWLIVALFLCPAFGCSHKVSPEFTLVTDQLVTVEVPDMPEFGSGSYPFFITLKTGQDAPSDWGITALTVHTEQDLDIQETEQLNLLSISEDRRQLVLEMPDPRLAPGRCFAVEVSAGSPDHPSKTKEISFSHYFDEEQDTLSLEPAACGHSISFDVPAAMLFGKTIPCERDWLSRCKSPGAACSFYNFMKGTTTHGRCKKLRWSLYPFLCRCDP